MTGCRDRVKTAIKKLKELYAFDTLEHMFADLEGTREGSGGLLLDLAEALQSGFRRKSVTRILWTLMIWSMRP